jgi:hypothetical protein
LAKGELIYGPTWRRKNITVRKGANRKKDILFGFEGE